MAEEASALRNPGRTVSRAPRCFGYTPAELQRLNFVELALILFIQVPKVDKMLKITRQSVEDAGGSKTRLCAKDHARTPAGFAAWSQNVTRKCLEELCSTI